MSAQSRRLFSRLQRDLAELHDQPYPGIAVFTDDADMRMLCLVLTPLAGPWTGLSLHFDVELPSDWPLRPPTIRSTVTGIPHPNIYPNPYGDWVFCDLIKPADEHAKGYTVGYSPALTLRGLFLQLLTLFSSRFVEQDCGGSDYLGDMMETNFVEEKHIVNTQYYYFRSRLKDDHRELETQWMRDSREEKVLAQYDTPDGLVSHTVKATEPSPDRIHAFRWRNPGWKITLDMISIWSCSKCPYGSPRLPHHSEKNSLTGLINILDIPEPQPPASGCVLHLLNDDVLLEIISHIQSETIITFGQAYPRFQELIAAHRVLLFRELKCFYLKTPLEDGILGIGVALHEPSRSLSSDFDWLSLDAFTRYDVRMSVQKRDFEFFLPLAFHQGHFNRAQKDIWERVALIDKAMQRANTEYSKVSLNPVHPRQSHDIFNVLFTMVNNIVVSLMKSCDDAFSTVQRLDRRPPILLHASEKAVTSYCHLMHLLICMCRTHPEILNSANRRVQLFVAHPRNRTKAVTPDMGELVVIITLILIMSPPNSTRSWATVAGPYLQETITRNVHWALRDAPELEVMEDGVSDYRLTTTFVKSRTSLRLVMFQVMFLDLFLKTYRPLGIEALDRNYGFPEPGLPERMVGEIKTIYAVKTWPEFFEKAQLNKQFSKESFSEMLREAVRASLQRGYHRRASDREMERLRALRNAIEKARKHAQAQMAKR